MKEIRQTHTFVELEISATAFEEIREKLAAAEYFHCLHDGYGKTQLRIDMQGIALKSTEWSAQHKLPLDDPPPPMPGDEAGTLT